ncbi:MAG: ATP-binding protein [Thermodesulfovibrionales bacterium]
MSLHVLDIAENSIEAGATAVSIAIREDTAEDRLTLTVRDNGRGLDRETAARALDPFYTSKAGKRWGLGIPLLAQAARECDGDFRLESEAGRGASVRASFRLGHIDLKPLGDMGATMAALVCGHPEVRYSFQFERDGKAFALDTGELRGLLEGVPLEHPAVLRYIKEEINEGIRRIKG